MGAMITELRQIAHEIRDLLKEIRDLLRERAAS